MKPAEFQELVARFAVRPVIPRGGQRHVYLWHGELAALEAHLPHGAAMHLDVHELTKVLPRRPTEPEGARQVLGQAIDQALRAGHAGPAVQQIVVVTGCDLLMRYSVSPGALFQAACDSRMVILVAPLHSAPAHPLPRYVDFGADATYNYLRSRLADAAVVQ